MSVSKYGLLVLTLFLSACATRTHWYKGNTHAHTNICDHADSPPEVVAMWYLDHGYHFAVLSEHNHFIDPGTVELPANRRKDFILIPGEEVTGHKSIHTTALDVQGLVDWGFDHEEKWRIIQHHVDDTIDAGGVPILNHPNYRYAVTTADLKPVKRLHLIELYNAHFLANNFGDQDHASVEELWDDLLTAGMRVYGIASDDAHHFGVWHGEVSNPGLGWTMVAARRLDDKSIVEAIARGHFYASSGVILSKLSTSGDSYVVDVDESATTQETAKPSWAGRSVADAKVGYTIAWIGGGGKILESVNASRASFVIPPGQPYVRARVRYVLETSRGTEAAYAWTQPVFAR